MAPNEKVGTAMQSKDIAWLAIAGLMGLKLATGLAVAGEPALQTQTCTPASYAVQVVRISQGEDARQACR